MVLLTADSAGLHYGLTSLEKGSAEVWELTRNSKEVLAAAQSASACLNTLPKLKFESGQQNMSIVPEGGFLGYPRCCVFNDGSSNASHNHERPEGIEDQMSAEAQKSKLQEK